MNYRLIFKNATANVVRIVVSVLVALLLPPFMVRMLTPEVFGAWSIILQLSVYVSFLDFGIQTAVSRFVANAHERNDAKQINRVMSASLLFLSIAALIGAVVVFIIASQFQRLFPEMSPALQREAQQTFIIIGLSLAIGLPASVFNSLFIGLQRNEIPIVILAGAKILSSLSLGVAVYLHADLFIMGVSFAGANLLSYLFQYLAVRKFQPAVELRLSDVSGKILREIASYCYALSVWSFGMLLVSNIDIVVVGNLDYSAVAYYTVAVSLTNFVIQLQSAVASALIPAVASLEARGATDLLSDLLVSSTRYGMFVLLACSLPLIVGAKPILTLWVGAEYAAQATNLLQILIFANVIRLVALPYANFLVGTGQQHLVLLSPLAEGLGNLITSILFGYYLGALGVALGTLFGSVISLGMHLFYNMPRTKGVIIYRWRLVSDGIARPLVCASPFVLLLPIIQIVPQDSLLLFSLEMVCCGLIALILFWYFGIGPDERKHVQAFLRIRVH